MIVNKTMLNSDDSQQRRQISFVVVSLLIFSAVKSSY